MGERRQFTIWIAASAVAVCSLIAVLVWEQSRKPVPRALYLVGDPQRGKALFYGEKRCSTCHAIDGNGATAAPDLSRERPGTPAMGWLAAKLWDHSPAMSRQIRGTLPYPKMTPEEMADMLAFLFQAGSAGHPGDPAAGEQVFREKGCAACHASAGLASATPNPFAPRNAGHCCCISATVGKSGIAEATGAVGVRSGKLTGCVETATAVAATTANTPATAYRPIIIVRFSSSGLRAPHACGSGNRRRNVRTKCAHAKNTTSPPINARLALCESWSR